MKKTYVTDMTVGKPLGLLVSFMLPLLIGNIFQQLYNIVDSIIVGQYVGADAADFAQFRMVTFSLCTNPLPVKNRKGFYLFMEIPLEFL